MTYAKYRFAESRFSACLFGLLYLAYVGCGVFVVAVDGEIGVVAALCIVGAVVYGVALVYAIRDAIRARAEMMES